MSRDSRPRRGTRLRGALTLLAFALVWLVPGWSWAGPPPYGVVTIDLQPERGEVPTDVCVVSQVQGPRTRTQVHGGLLGASGGGTARARSYALAESFWPHGGADQTSCGEGSGCAAQVSLPPARSGQDLWAACATDELLDETASDVERRLLVLVVEHLEGSPPIIEALRLTGGIVTVGVRARLDDIVVTARSAGGHFLPTPRSVRATDAGADAKLIVLPIEPRCDWLPVEIPGRDLSAAAPSDLRVHVHGLEVDAGVCTAPVPGTRRRQILAPRAANQGRIALRWDAPSEASSTAAGPAHFEAEWSGAWPAETLRLEPRQVDFTWRRPACVYPTDACPAAVVEGGVACTVEGDAEGCHYRCPGDEVADADPSLSVETPLTVTFRDQRSAQDQRWTQILVRRGQILEGFVEPDRIYLEADVSDWERTVPGNRVTHLEVLGNDGSVRRYTLDGASTLSLRAPEAGCEPLRYRLVGERFYKERTAEVRDGKVWLDPPEASVRSLDFMLVILQGGGPAYAMGAPLELSNPIYFNGLAQISASWRPRKPKLSRLAVELRLGGTIGQWGYFDEQSYETLPEPIQVRERVIWARFLVEPALVVDVWGPFALGVGLGMGSSWPINSKETDNTSRYRFVVAPSAEGRIRVRKWLYLVAQVRGVFREKTFIALDDGAGRFRREEFDTISVLGLYGLGFRF